MKWWLRCYDPDVNGTGGGGGSADAGAAGAGSSGGTDDKGAAGGDAGKQVTDQEFEVKTADGKVVKVRASDIIDDKGVPFKNRAAEANRRAQSAEEAAAALHQGRVEGDGKPEVKEGEYIDPADGQKYTEEDINRMFMTGEGVKANRIVLGQVNVRKIVSDVNNEHAIKERTIAKYPDIQNPQSPMFQRVAKYMATNDLYGRPNGLELAATAVAEQLTDEGIPFTKRTVSSPESQRRSQNGAGVVKGGDGQKGGEGKVELDEAGLAMARKLGVDPAKMADRLSKHLATRTNNRSREE